MESFASPIRIPMVRATVLHCWLVTGHLLMLGALIWICPPAAHTSILVALVLVSLALEVGAVGMPDRRCKVLLLGRNDEWSVITAAGEHASARLLAGFFVSSRLIVLRLRPSGARSLHVVLTRANTPPAAFRRLRVRLRYPLAAATESYLTAV